MRRLAALAVALLPAAGFAHPVTRIVDVTAGTEQFFRLNVKAVTQDSPSVASVELLPSEELLVTPKTSGRVLVLAWAESSIEGIRLRVREKAGKAPEVLATDAQRAAARKACPGLKESREGARPTLEANVSTPACREALRPLLESDDYLVEDLELAFSPEVLQAQLRGMREGLKRDGADVFELAYQGVQLVVKGKATPEQKQKLMKVAFENSLGRVIVDDQTEAVDAPKASAAQKP